MLDIEHPVLAAAMRKGPLWSRMLWGRLAGSVARRVPFPFHWGWVLTPSPRPGCFLLSGEGMRLLRGRSFFYLPPPPLGFRHHLQW